MASELAERPGDGSGPSCRISIQLDKKDRTYQAGEVITGKVIIQALQPCQWKELILSRQWRTHGRVRRDQGGDQFMVLAKELEYQGGTEFSYRFSFAAPFAPVSQRGTSFNRDWYLQARLEQGRGVERIVPSRWSSPKTECEFILLPNSNQYQIETPPSANPSSSLDDIIGALLFIALFLMPLFLCTGATTDFTIFLKVSLIIVAGSVALLFAVARNQLAELIVLGKVRTQVIPMLDSRGLKAVVQLSPKRDVQVSYLDVQLSIKEHVTVVEGSRTRVHVKELFGRLNSRLIDHTLAADQPTELDVDMELPAGLPTTTNRGSVAIIWTITVKVRTENRFSWQRRFPITVYG